MSRWFQAWRREADVEGTWDDVYSIFDFSEQVFQDGLEKRYEYSRSETVFDWRFEWIVEPGDGAISVTEKAYVSRLWFVVAFLLIFGCLASFVVGERSQGILNVVLSFGAVILFAGYVFVVSRVFEYGGPVADFYQDQPDQDVYQPYVSLLLALLPPVLAILFTTGVVQYVSLAVVFVFNAMYMVQAERIERISLGWQRGYVRFWKQFPAIISDYSLRLFTSALPMIFFVVVFQDPTFIQLVESIPYISTLVFAGLAISMLTLVRMGMAYSNRIGEARFRSEGREVSNKLFLRIAVIIGIITAAGFGYLCYLFFNISQKFLLTAPVFPAGIMIVIAAFPILFLLCGFVYQYWSLLSGLYLLARKMERKDLTDSYWTETETYVLDYDGLYAGAGSLLWHDFIVVSKGLKENLSSEQLDSVIAHEDCHIVEDEPRNSVLVALFSPLILLGKNVVYAMFDFRAREYRADRYSAQITDPKHLIGALERLQGLKATKTTQEEKIESVIPTLTSMSPVQEGKKSSLASIYLEYYFGDFAVTGVHPTLDDRIKRIKQEWNT